jgi:redox-regulated HSP33 family molecular chaperone
LGPGTNEPISHVDARRLQAMLLNFLNQHSPEEQTGENLIKMLNNFQNDDHYTHHIDHVLNRLREAFPQPQTPEIQLLQAPNQGGHFFSCCCSEIRNL